MKAITMNAFRLAAAVLVFAMPAQADVNIQEVISPGGIKAWLVEDNSIPFAALEIRFVGGPALDAEGKRGAGNLMAGLLKEGTGDLDSQGFAEAMGSLSADFSFFVDDDKIEVSARFLTESRDESLELLRRALVEPRFDQASIDRLRGKVISLQQADEKEPFILGEREMKKQAFGDHPYGSENYGTMASVTALNRDDIVAAYKGALARDRVLVSAAGDLSADELGTLLDRLLGGLPETGAPQPERAQVNAKGGVTVIDIPGPQAFVAFFQNGIEISDPDYIAASILNEVMGGGRFSARLMTEMREERGLTYGVGTVLKDLDRAELLTGQFGTANETVAEAIEVVRGQWLKMATEGLDAQELQAAKEFMTGSFPLLFNGNQTIAQLLAQMQFFGMPVDYPSTYTARVNAVTLEDIKRVSARVFRPDDLRFVVVGQPEGVVSSD